jgi:hypothetical protein
MRTYLKKPIIIVYAIVLILISASFWACEKSTVKAKRVILIGIDGMGVSGFQQARTPNLDQLVRRGALSFNTRGVMPTVSAPNWGSHLLGAGPEQHGITYNGWTTSHHTVMPTETDEAGYFPSVFNLLHDQKPGVKTGFFYDWDALADLFNLAKIDKVDYSRTYAQTFEKVTPWITANDPGFTFIYIGHPDEVGHAHQWGSAEYIQALEEVDAALGVFFDALKKAAMFEDTYFIIVADHGGVGYGHGGLSMEEIEVPWIISGPGVIQNRMIVQPNDVFNTASTIAWLLDVEQPYSWIGRPVMGAFTSSSLSKMNTTIYVPQPVTSLQSGLYTESQAIAVSVSDPEVTLRITLNGKDPDSQSPVYKDQVLLMKSTRLKAAAFMDGQRSRIATVDFVKVKALTNARLSHQPAEKYGASGVSTLTDLQRGSSDFKDGNWLGFEGVDLLMDITMDNITDISNFRLGFLNLPGSWIFPPQRIEILASVDGNRYYEIGSMTAEQIADQVTTGMNELQVKIKPSKVRYLTVRAQNIGLCPDGHPGAGKPAWLFVDEIIVE